MCPLWKQGAPPYLTCIFLIEYLVGPQRVREENVAETEQQNESAESEVSSRVFTVPNVITFIRLCMAPIAFVLLVQGNNLAACAVFSISAATDFLDGQIARRTHTVSKIGQLLDPMVDRLLMICAVLGLMIVGWLPVWIVVLVLARDALLLAGGSFLLRKYGIRIPVIYPGKVATTFLFVGLAGLMLNMPQIPGLGWCDFAWLPGFNHVSCSWGIWSIYIGLCIGIGTTIYYVVRGYQELRKALRERK